MEVDFPTALAEWPVEPVGVLSYGRPPTQSQKRHMQSLLALGVESIPPGQSQVLLARLLQVVGALRLGPREPVAMGAELPARGPVLRAARLEEQEQHQVYLIVSQLMVASTAEQLVAIHPLAAVAPPRRE